MRLLQFVDEIGLVDQVRCEACCHSTKLSAVASWHDHADHRLTGSIAACGAQELAPLAVDVFRHVLKPSAHHWFTSAA
jgi:hypothetical protein